MYIPKSSHQSASIVHHYTCSLNSIIGAITDSHQPDTIRDNSIPAGLRMLVDAFLESFGYDANVKLAIAHAYCISQDAEAFQAYLCPKGMTSSEAGWLFDYIIFTNHNEPLCHHMPLSLSLYVFNNANIFV